MSAPEAVTHLFAGLHVRDITVARPWYERLLGRSPDLLPHAAEAAWQLTTSGWLYIIAGDGDPGGGVVTLLVSDLDSELAALAGRDLAPERVEPVGEAGRKATFVDPDGNRVALAQPGR